MDSSYSIRSRNFDVTDGIPGPVPAGFWNSILTRAPDGKIWISTDSGVAFVEPRRLTLKPAPTALIEGVRVDGRELMPGEAEVPPGRHDLEIDYTVTNFATADRVQFRYRLDGADDEWHDAGTRRRAYFGGLAPGEYRFRVATTNGDGVWNEAGEAKTFRLLPAWYQTVWLRIGVVLLIGAVGATAAAFVQRRRHVRVQETLNDKYQATLAERERIAQDLHDTLLQGFIGVTLQLKAAERALPTMPDVASDTIRRVQVLARDSLREARERVRDMRQVDQSNDDVPAALEMLAHERTSGMGIEIASSVIGERCRLDRRIEDAAFRIGREAVANAITHAEAKRIEIVSEFVVGAFKLEIRDDGRGFSPEEAEDARREGHFGLTGIRERASHLGGRCDVIARVGGGTVVALELPLVERSLGV
ncbi:MAG: histidine kinase, partial [Gemmatimonadaceae bacterium]